MGNMSTATDAAIAMLQLSPAARAELERARQQVKALPEYLMTPDMWAELAMSQAMADNVFGTSEGDALMAECRRYLACAELVRALAMAAGEARERCGRLESELAELKGLKNTAAPADNGNG